MGNWAVISISLPRLFSCPRAGLVTKLFDARSATKTLFSSNPSEGLPVDKMRSDFSLNTSERLRSQQEVYPVRSVVAGRPRFRLRGGILVDCGLKLSGFR